MASQATSTVQLHSCCYDRPYLFYEATAELEQMKTAYLYLCFHLEFLKNSIFMLCGFFCLIVFFLILRIKHMLI